MTVLTVRAVLERLEGEFEIQRVRVCWQGFLVRQSQENRWFVGKSQVVRPKEDKGHGENGSERNQRMIGRQRYESG